MSQRAASPVNAEVQLALVLQQGLQLLFGLSDRHALGKHRVHQELTGLGKEFKALNVTLFIIVKICQHISKVNVV